MSRCGVCSCTLGLDLMQGHGRRNGSPACLGHALRLRSTRFAAVLAHIFCERAPGLAADGWPCDDRRRRLAGSPALKKAANRPNYPKKARISAMTRSMASPESCG
jgi:hypothetical protein